MNPVTAPSQPKLDSFQDLAALAGKKAASEVRPVICVQGLGFVGSVMALAIANARHENKELCFNVIGVDLPTEAGEKRISALNQGKMVFEVTDEKLADALKCVDAQANFVACSDERAYGLASVVVADIPLDLDESKSAPAVKWEPFKKAIRALGKNMRPGSLLIVETTVPPGTCEKVVLPILKEEFVKRGLPENAVHLAHSYERVMPGKDYFDSIVNFWRVYAGHTEEAADLCRQFFEKIVNTKQFPLTRLASTKASETAKVLENSYRAANIAFIEEWGRFAESIGVDLFEVIQAIRVRPTHSNIRQPGFGVGGYCLTKDPLFAAIAAKDFFNLAELDFPFSKQAVAVNARMPLVSLEKLEKALPGGLKGKKILLLGISYREDVGDTRYSPSEIFFKHALSRGAQVTAHDPLLNHWQELDLKLPEQMPSPQNFNAVVFAVSHSLYKNLNVSEWLGAAKPLILDANCVLSRKQMMDFKSAGCSLISIGRGGA